MASVPQRDTKKTTDIKLKIVKIKGTTVDDTAFRDACNRMDIVDMIVTFSTLYQDDATAPYFKFQYIFGTDISNTHLLPKLKRDIFADNIEKILTYPKFEPTAITYALIGHVCYKIGDSKTAEYMLNTAYEMDGYNVYVNLHLAFLNNNLGNTELHKYHMDYVYDKNVNESIAFLLILYSCDENRVLHHFEENFFDKIEIAKTYQTIVKHDIRTFFEKGLHKEYPVLKEEDICEEIHANYLANKYSVNFDKKKLRDSIDIYIKKKNACAMAWFLFIYYNRLNMNRVVIQITDEIDMKALKSPELYMWRGRALQATKQYERAVNEFKNAQKFGSNNAIYNITYNLLIVNKPYDTEEIIKYIIKMRKMLHTSKVFNCIPLIFVNNNIPNNYALSLLYYLIHNGSDTDITKSAYELGKYYIDNKYFNKANEMIEIISKYEDELGENKIKTLRQMIKNQQNNIQKLGR